MQDYSGGDSVVLGMDPLPPTAPPLTSPQPPTPLPRLSVAATAFPDRNSALNKPNQPTNQTNKQLTNYRRNERTN